MALTGSQYEQLNDALVDAFPTPDELTMMVKFKLGKSLAALVGAGGSVTYQVFQLIQKAEAQGWTADLIVGARQMTPRNEKLMLAAQDLNLTAIPAKPQLERIIKDTNSFLDIVKFREALADIEAQVCRIRVTTDKGRVFGTGFLCGPDLIMTNYHVVDAVIAGEDGKTNSHGRAAKAADVICQFDYKKASGYLNSGVEVPLKTGDWLVDQSPPSTTDEESEPKSGVPKEDELDYAILRLVEATGSRPVGAKPGEASAPGAPKRGWIKVPTKPFEFAKKSPIFIVQHPDGAPLSLALDTTGVLGTNGNDTRVKYETNTLEGSSGSPCFNQNWELVALHHSGDPNFDPVTKPKYNQGIPVAAIRALLKSRNRESVLDA